MAGLLIGDQLKAARKLKGVKTARDLAGLVDKPRFGDKVIGQIERNDRHAQPHEIEWLADALGIPPTYLTETPTPEPDRLQAIEQRLSRIEATLGRVERAISPESLLPGVRGLLEALEEDRHATSPQTAPTAK